MDFPVMNPLAIVLAGGASYLFGGLWYNFFGGAWLAAIGKTYEQLQEEGGLGPKPMVIALLAQLVMACVLGGAIGYLGEARISLLNGVATALLVWIGFIVTTLVTNNQFQAQGWRLTLIDGGHWFCVLLIQGAIIGWMGL